MMSDNDKESAISLLAEDEDLPPGVRKHNRCHSSGSSSESDNEIDKKKPSKDADTSDSDSDQSDHVSAKKDGKDYDVPQPDKPKSQSKEKEISSKVKRSRSGSGSRSKSRSRSASPKRRRSSEKSRHSRSRSRERRHKRDKRRRSYRSRSKERRRSRDRHRHKRDHKRSRSRSRDRRDRRPERKSSRDIKRSRRSRSRERRRDSRSPSPRDGKVIKFGDKVIKPGASFGRPSSNFTKPLTFKEKMRQQLIKAIEDGADTNDVLANKGGSTICTQSAGVMQQTIPKPKGPPIPLMDAIVSSTAGTNLAAMTVTASEAAMQSMLALQKEATEKTGIEIPKYYNPAAINPMKYAEQVQKRKLLWSKAKDKDVNSQWHATSLSGDADDKSKEKFRKLMGIKEDPVSGSAGVEGEQEEKQKQIFEQLNKEYEFARMTTHTHRGVGLGFGSTGYQPPPTTG